MSQITNDIEFKQALEDLDATQQRIVAGKFVEHVLPLSSDKRLKQVINVATDADATDDEMSNALKSARAATFDSHTRCGSEGHWIDQAGYFVARAATASVTPGEQSKSGGPAWQAALSIRMAQTCVLIDSDDVTPIGNEWQYNILTNHLNS